MQKKLVLNIDALRVESFELSSVLPEPRGTVRANESETNDTMDLRCWKLKQATWDQSCQIGTCGASCDSCNYTCGGTCEYSCGCNFTDQCG